VVLPVDANGSGQAEAEEVLDTKAKAMQAVASGKYPSPPARALNLVTKGKPSGLLQDFIVWAMTDGQQYVDSAGYIPLTPELLSEGLQKIK
jgi:phosphate transport system substrate-binding protein